MGADLKKIDALLEHCTDSRTDKIVDSVLDEALQLETWMTAPWI